MSEPAKKPGQPPESYSPKAKPEIVSMAAVQSAPQAKELTENVLQGIPHMRYGDPSPVCFIGSVMRLMEYLQDPIDQDELFALSGAGLCFPWRYQSCCDEISVIPAIPQRTFAALGYESEYYYEPDISSGARTYSKAFYAEKIKRSIDSGRPVLGFGFTADVFTCLICGYYNDGDGLYMRAFWSPEGTPEGYDTEQYYSADDWYGKCHGIVVVGEKTGERLSGERAYAHIRETAAIFSKMASVSEQGKVIYTGPSAFDAMIAWLLDDSQWEGTNLHDQGVFLNPAGILLLMYYRNSLYEYLKVLAEACPGLVNPAVFSAIERMRPLIPGRERNGGYVHEAVHRKLGRFAAMRKRGLREKVATCVTQLKALDGELFGCLLEPPAGYSPKAKPEILRVLGEIKMENDAAQSAASSGGNKILPGVPKVSYGTYGGITPFPICLKAVSDYLGDELDYTYAIVASGGAFRFAWDTTEWNPGNVDIMLAYDDAERPFYQGITALGREFKMLWREKNIRLHPGDGTQEDFKAFIREQIDLGRPVIALGPIGPGEAGLLTGYREGGDTLLGWSLFQDWECKTFDDEGYFIADRWWDDDVDFHGVMALGDITGPRMGVRQIVQNAIVALEGKQESNYAKGVVAYDAWKRAILNADKNDFAMKCAGMHLVMMCQGDATDCLIDGRKHAHKYFAALAQENPDESLYAEIAEQFGIVATTIHEKIYKALHGYQRDKKQIKALEKTKTRLKICGCIDMMKAADEKALALMKELLAAMDEPPEGYGPKAKPEILKLLAGVKTDDTLPSDTIADPFAGGEPPRVSNRILGCRPILRWENYYLPSAISSVAKLVGFDEEALEMFDKKNGNKGTHFFSAITGDMFTPMYESTDEKPADSGFTAFFFAPQVIKKAYAAFGRECVYLSAEYIKQNLHTVTNAIKASIDKGLPVLSWGWGNATLTYPGTPEGVNLTEGCFIGAYENDRLYVNGPDWIALDDDGYSTTPDGLSGSRGLFLVGEPTEKTPPPQVYREAIAAIPERLTLPPAEGIVFGKAAFNLWADTLLDETRFAGKAKKEIKDMIWSIHCKAYCNVCTSNAEHFIKAAARELESAARLLPLYEQFFKRKDRIWKLQGGFEPPVKKFRRRRFREKIAGLLREMGALCEEIVCCAEH